MITAVEVYSAVLKEISNKYNVNKEGALVNGYLGNKD